MVVAGVAELTSKRSAEADRAAGKVFVDCSNVPLLSGEMLGKLILLQGRLKQKQSRLVLSGLRAEVRDVLRWTKIDRFFEIEEDAFQKGGPISSSASGC